MGQLTCSVTSATLRGVEAIPVSVEVVITNGIPSFSIVGMPDVAIQESRERVRAAIKACGFTMPSDKIVVNLAPGSVRKHGSGFDLPIALGILVATNQVSANHVENALVTGELSLAGGVRATEGLLAHQYCAQTLGCRLITGEMEESVVLYGKKEVLTLSNLSQLRQTELPVAKKQALPSSSPGPDFSQVKGHEVAKRAMQIAAAGNHGMLMVGPPGSGKTMLARCLAGLLPPLTEQQCFESALIHSVAGERVLPLLSGVRPFRDPHHSCTQAGLLGGGSPVKPGEASLAHNGVLFLDELAEFKTSVLQGLRQPLEEGTIHITRADGVYVFPAQFMLVAATNPCPCGYYGDPFHECHCSESQIRSYQSRIGGPLLDRIDIRIEVWSSTGAELLQEHTSRSTAELKQEVLAAKKFAQIRRAKHSKALQDDQHAQPSTSLVESNKKELMQTDLSTESKSAFLSAEGLNQRRDFSSVLASCAFTKDSKAFLASLVESQKLGVRSVLKTLLVARTIADLEQSEEVNTAHLSEAYTLRFQGELLS